MEREHLHRLARRPQRPTKSAPNVRIRPELLRVLDLIPDAPAFIVDHRLDVVVGSPLAELLYRHSPMKGLNIARQIFLDDDGRSLYAGWDARTRDTVGHLRLAAGKYPDDPKLSALIGELAVHSDRFRKLWARADVRSRTHGRKAFAHPLVGTLDLHQENFALS